MQENNKKTAPLSRLFFSKDDAARLRRGVVLFAVFFLAAFLGLGYHAYDSARTSNATIWKEKVDADMRGILLLIDSTNPGDWAVQDGRIYKGGRLLNDNGSFVDHLKEVTGSEVALFVGDAVASSTYDVGGKRLAGQKADAAVTKIVLTGCTPYLGRSDLGGLRPIGSYRTLFDEEGEAVGMIFVGVPEASEERSLGTLTNSLALAGLALLLLVLTGLGLLLAYTGRIALHLKKAGEETAAQMPDVSDVPRAEAVEVQQTPPLAGAAFEAVPAEALSRMGAFCTTLLAGTEAQAQAMESALAQVGAWKEQAEKAASLLSAAKVDGDGDETQEAQRAAEETCRRLGESRAAADAAAERTDALAKELAAANEMANGLGKRAAAIGETLVEVAELASQTNILAFNAAVEAARAGEAGRRFAAVADQVRRLSEDAGKLSSNAAELLTALAGDVAKAAEAIEAGGAGAEESRAALRTLADTAMQLEESARRVERCGNSRDDLQPMLDEVRALHEQMAEDAQKLLAIKDGEEAKIAELRAAADGLRVLLGTALPMVEAAAGTQETDAAADADDADADDDDADDADDAGQAAEEREEEKK